MSNKPTPEFVNLLARVMADYGKPLPDAPVIHAWWTALAPFKPNAIRQAFSDYSIERPDFAPVPNSIAARCKLLDTRPDEDEAWAMSLLSQDERETVVWTAEMSRAFHTAKPLLDAGDEVGARMAFKDAYSRLVSAARAVNQPAVWSVSAGWDGERRQIAVRAAVTAGLLEGPQQHLALPNESGLTPERPEGLKRVLEAVSQLEDPRIKAERIHDERKATEYEAEQAQKAAINERVRNYGKPEAE